MDAEQIHDHRWEDSFTRQELQDVPRNPRLSSWRSFWLFIITNTMFAVHSPPTYLFIQDRWAAHLPAGQLCIWRSLEKIPHQ